MQLRHKPLPVSSFTKTILNLKKTNSFLLNSTNLVFYKKIDIDPFRNYIVLYGNEVEFSYFLIWLKEHTKSKDINYSKITSNLTSLQTTVSTKLFYFSYIVEIENLPMDFLLSYLSKTTNMKLIGFLANSVFYWADEFVTFKNNYIDFCLFSSSFSNINLKDNSIFDSYII
jgi:hypothetical protein